MATVLFDGKCNLCNGAVQFIIDHERDHALSFASLQSDEGRGLLESVADASVTAAILGGASGDPTSVVFVDGERAFTHSAAALKIAGHLRWPWSWGRVGVVVPQILRDAIYRWIAKNRYRWFGKTEACRVPTPELRARFLEKRPAQPVRG